mgnify:FL=1
MAKISNEKKKVKNKKKVNHKKTLEENEIELGKDLFSFDDEMVIGVNKKREENTLKKKKNNTKNNSKKNKKKKNNKKPKNKKTKRMLTDEEIEIQRIKRMKKLKIAKYLMLIALFITLIVVTMFSPLFNIKSIVVTGNNKITQNEIISLSQVQLEENTYKINKYKVKQRIKENAYIEDVTIKRKLPSELQISIVERQVAFMIEYGASFVYIDNQGYILEISENKLELPILQGIQTESAQFEAGKRLENEDLQKMNTVLKIMEIAKNNDISNIITRIDIEDEENYKIIFETKEKTAYLGDNSNLNTKILTIKAILEKNEGIAGEIFVNMDLNTNYPIFRERV